ncbi:hypothetical protein FXO37_25265 [Capsicum annuum]|nr:hypothetical protein FXO37_25265 [Capsicum annuum]
MLKELIMNISLLKALEKISRYAIFMNELVTKKRAISYEDAGELHHCSAIISRYLAQKKGDPRAFIIPCTIWTSRQFAELGWCCIDCLMVGYNIDFTAIIRYEIHERAFGELTTLPFPCLVQQLYNEAGVPKVLGVNLRVKAMGVSQTSLIKDSTNLILAQRNCRPLTVILVQFEGQSIPEEPSDR